MRKFFLLLVMFCSGCGEEGNDQLSSLFLLLQQGLLTSVAQPADNTAILILGSNSFLLDDVVTCGNGLQGFALRHSGATGMPALVVHDVDFSTASPSFPAGGGWLDVFVSNGSYGPVQPCPAIVHRNDALYDVELRDCTVTSTFGSNPVPTTTTVSFRVRCIKF